MTPCRSPCAWLSAIERRRPRAAAFWALFAWACASPPATAPPQSTILETRSYSARGNEPFWRLDLSDRGVRFATPERQVSSEEPAVRASASAAPSWRGFSVQIAGENLVVDIEPLICRDSMSGQFYPETVSVTFDGASLSGCGGAPMDLLVGSWRLEAIGAATGSPGPQGAFLTIAADGRLSGSTGCNRMFGQLMATGEGIAITGLGTTRMACLDPALALQERRVTQGLAGATAFSIDSQGRLLLPDGASDPLRWVRIDP